MDLTEFDIQVGGRTVTCTLVDPPEMYRKEDPGLVIVFSAAHRESLNEDLCDAAARAFVRTGQRVLNLDLLAHGSRMAGFTKEGIEGWRDALLAGQDPFKAFVDEGIAAIDECVRRQLARPGHIYVYGISRGGYGALRLAAADPRITAVAILQPVTDWCPIREFAAVKDRPEVKALAMDHWAEKFVGRTVWAAIGACDDRVATYCCVRFMSRIFEAEQARVIKPSHHVLHVDDQTLTHALRPQFYIDGGEFLAQLAVKNRMKK